MKKFLLIVFSTFFIGQLAAQNSIKVQLEEKVFEENDNKGLKRIDIRAFLERDEREVTTKILAKDPDYFNKIKLSKKNAYNFKVGDTKEWYAIDGTKSLQETGRFYKTKSTCRAVGANCYIFVEDSLWNTRVDQTSVNEIMKSFDAKTPANPAKGIYQTDIETFGNPPNIDGDDKIIIFILNIIDQFYYNPKVGGYTVGYFYSYDQLYNSDLVASGYPEGSNESDIFYLDANPLNLLTENGLTDGMNTAAHEFQHMIHFNYHNDSAGKPRNSELVNEGCSLIAELVCGYPFREQSRYSKESNFKLFGWRRDDANLVLNDYSRAARFMLYFYDQFGAGILKNIVQSSYANELGLQDALSKSGSALTVKEVISNWHIANIVSDKSIDSKYGYDKVQNITTMVPDVLSNPTQNLSADVWGYGAKYYQFKNAKDLKIKFSSTNNNVKVKAFKKETKEVLDVATNTEVAFPTFGTDYENLYFIVSHLQNTDDGASVYVNSTGTIKNSTVELKYDTKETTGILTLAVGDSAAVVFDAIPGARLDSVLIAIRNLSPLSGEICERGTTTFSGKKLKDFTVTGTVYNGSPYPAVWNNWGKIDLTKDNIDASKSFVVKVCYDGAYVGGQANGPNRVMVQDYPGNSYYHSNWYKAAESRWIYYTKDDDNIWLNIIRAYGSFETVDNEREIFEITPQVFTLNQNYPNPFNPATTISYELDKANDVVLEVFDMTGALVKTLVKEYKQAGTHTVIWDGTNTDNSKVASGVYLYRITAGSNVSTKKMIVLK